ncbi:hypothetical protein [Nocardioides marmotae]|uniref:Uncharacterized protein n=1 Tax=Nocardioides marmotae TaxID=2663857 RepID=A0A6I3IZ31_9ACTN|nr:hypothetical protein [Nocardioides marmotae]MCR6030703.1 hypothetical protein [Gordonia jinghuaiqii]MBC9734029.1 hypothetical protein [Nocardioides marmotae]MTB85132.1 hypothetical protein [Nocardioides marmotae]MTB94337.1 hypothetical protein [Nocardioides marmotae]QKE01635.1 hypothetical protein HPC71_11490 [Nocardioides marmotae]
MQHPRRPHPRSGARRPAVLVVAGLLAWAPVGWPTTAQAAGPSQSALCDGYTAGPCSLSVTTDAGAAAPGQLLRVTGEGNPGTRLVLQFYVVEFNSRGQVTGLVPSGDPVEGTTRALTGGRGTLDQVRLVPRAVPEGPSGWGFVGLADDSSLDLSTRIGQVVEFSGATLRLLGDGYADQKPVGVPLDMHAIGNVPGVGYWVEYLADDGSWTPVPGHGYGAAQRLRSSPGEISHLSYVVPADLVPGQAYRFRVNHHLNYGGAEDRPVAAPAYAEWTVVPSEHGEAGTRDEQLDPAKGPGVPDPEGPAGNDGGGPGGGGGSPAPGPGPGAPAAPQPSAPSAPAAPAPTPAPGSPPAPGAAPTSAPPASATAAPATPGQGSQGSPQPQAPGSTAPGATAPGAASPAAAGSAPATSSDPVWGEEARPLAAPRIAEAAEPTKWMLAGVLVALLATPALGVWLRRRTASSGRGEAW